MPGRSDYAATAADHRPVDPDRPAAPSGDSKQRPDHRVEVGRVQALPSNQPGQCARGVPFDQHAAAPSRRNGDATRGQRLGEPGPIPGTAISTAVPPPRIAPARKLATGSVSS